MKIKVVSKAKSKTAGRRGSLESLGIVNAHAAGVDLAAEEHVVCAPDAREGGTTEVRRFGSVTSQLRQMVAWFQQCGVTSVAMESTSVYWIPLYELLEAAGIEPVLVNARQLHKVPGRKTDVIDCQWIQKLHACGLLRGSFRPAAEICELRALSRQRENLVGERSKATLWMQKSLDQMNVQVHRAVTDVTGTTGLAIIRAIVAGERDPRALAALRDPRCKKSVAEIALHLEGTWKREHLWNLEQALALFDHLQQSIQAYDERLRERLAELAPTEREGQPAPAHPKASKAKASQQTGDEALRTALWRLSGVDLTTIDGLATGTAQVILTELGPDLSAFPTERDFVSWLRLCPRTAISGGKPLPKRRQGQGANRIGGILRMAAVSLSRSKTPALGAEFRRIARRKNGKVAVFAIARKLAQHIYRLLRHGQAYVDIGVQAYEALWSSKRLQALHQQAQQLGFVLTPASIPE
jgi:transposase